MTLNEKFEEPILITKKIEKILNNKRKMREILHKNEQINGYLDYCDGEINGYIRRDTR